MRRTLLRIVVIALACCLVATLAVSAQQLYADQATLATDATFISRVKIAAIQYAINNVSVESGDVQSHAARYDFARKVVQDPDTWAKLLTVGVVGDLTFTANVSDAAIFSRIDRIWNVYAGA